MHIILSRDTRHQQYFTPTNMMRVCAFDHVEQRNLESLGEVIEVVIKVADLGVFSLQHHLHVQVGQAPTVSFEPA